MTSELRRELESQIRRGILPKEPSHLILQSWGVQGVYKMEWIHPSGFLPCFTKEQE